MRLGFHLSIAKGLAGVLNAAAGIGCETVQIFVRNPRRWRCRSFKDSEIRSFAVERLQRRIWPLVVHLSYLPNLASRKPELKTRSRRVLAEEWALATELRADYLVTHAGHHLGEGCDGAHFRIAESIASVLSENPLPPGSPILLLENAAGQGSEVGARLGELRRIRQILGDAGQWIGFCLDTAHAFAAGYAIDRPRGLRLFLEAVRLELGLANVRLLHLNDSKAPCGSRVDRHWHVGCGAIGERGFRRIIQSSDLSRIPAVMETPKEHEEDDLENLYRLRKLS